MVKQRAISSATPRRARLQVSFRALLAVAVGCAALFAQVLPAAASTSGTSPAVAVVPPVNPPPDLPAINCNQESTLATQNTDTPAQILFWNQTLEPVQVDSLNTLGQRTFQFRLQPGASLLQNTFLTVPWVLTDNSDPVMNDGTGRGLCHGIFLANAAPGTAHLMTHAETFDPNCLASVLAANDDGSTGFVPFGFTANFFGVAETGGYINNNGNFTFSRPLGTYTPFSIASSGVPILAPYFADVWTYGQSYQVHYGQTTVGGHPALCVDWAGVGYYAEDARHLNNFQMLVVDRPDLGVDPIHGDTFDLIYNYEQLTWESGQASGSNTEGLGGASARVGYSNGVQAFELAGSGINGAFLDSNPGGLIHRTINSSTQGQLVFQIPNATTIVNGKIQGHVVLDGTTPIPNALVIACNNTAGGVCVATNTDAAGFFSEDNLPDGAWSLQAEVPSNFPPGNLPPGNAGPITILNSNTVAGVLINIQGPPPPPAGFGIVNINPDGTFAAPRTTFSGGVQVDVVYWGRPTHTVVTGCPDAITATYHVLVVQNNTVFDGALTQTAPGSGVYYADLPPFYPAHGTTNISFHFVCADPTLDSDPQVVIYIDPSGTTSTIGGVAIANATVTLLRQDSVTGSFDPVANGDTRFMSPGNTRNPDLTDALGQFGWDVTPGTYRVTASFTTADGVSCGSVTTGNLVVTLTTPPITGLSLQFDCGVDNLDPNEPATGSGLPGADPSPTGATPELDSLVLFGTGAAGMASFALTRLRASRRKADHSEDESTLD